MFGNLEPAVRRFSDYAALAAAPDPVSQHLAAAELTSSGRRASQRRPSWLGCAPRSGH
jgi:hypothetical protein